MLAYKWHFRIKTVTLTLILNVFNIHFIKQLLNKQNFFPLITPTVHEPIMLNFIFSLPSKGPFWSRKNPGSRLKCSLLGLVFPIFQKSCIIHGAWWVLSVKAPLPNLNIYNDFPLIKSSLLVFSAGGFVVLCFVCLKQYYCTVFSTKKMLGSYHCCCSFCCLCQMPLPQPDSRKKSIKGKEKKKINNLKQTPEENVIGLLYL